MFASGIRSSRARNFVGLTPLVALAMGAWLVAACGARTEIFTPGSDASPGAGGSLPSAGAGGAPALAGANSGPAGSGGERALCGNLDCAGVICPNGFDSTPSCPIGAHSVKKPGDCCPTCAPDVPVIPSCQEGRTEYEALRKQLLDKYSHNCCADSECVAVPPLTLCDVDCARVAVRSAVVIDFDERLTSEGAIFCAACKPDFLSCGPAPSAICVNHVCQLVPP